MAKRRKVRVSLQKNRSKRRRQGDWTRQYHDDEQATETASQSERIRAKGELSRKRTVEVEPEGSATTSTDGTVRGRVLTTQGLYCGVISEDGQSYRCYTRRLLKSLQTDERGTVTTGDWVWFRPAPDQEGFIVRVEPRRNLLTRGYRRREQVIAANIEQALIVGSLLEPPLKPNLIDRYLISAQQGQLDPIVCFNKVDLADAYLVAPLVGIYSQLGYRLVLTSAATGQGISQLREALAGRETVIVGQSGVGKSSLLNAMAPTFRLRVGEVSASSHKGRHTTTTAQLLRLPEGGTVIDTPGIRQFELWDLQPGEVEGFFIELRPFATHCHFPGCTHTHEESCAVKAAVADQLISAGRYESYLRLLGDCADR